MKSILSEPTLKNLRQNWGKYFSIVTLVELLFLYIAFSPMFAMGLYNQALFFPLKEKYDLKPVIQKIESATNSKWQEVTIPGVNKTTLNGWYFQRKNANKLVIVSHGNGGNIAHRILLVPPLLLNNGSVLLYDYEGYGQSTGTPTIAGVKQDGLSVYDYAINQLHYKPENIVLYGESLGSGVTVHIAEHRKVAGVIIQSGFASLMMAAKDHLPFLRLYPSIAFAGNDFDNLNYLRGKHVPLLWLHGIKDQTLSVSYADLVEKEATQPKRIVKFEGAGHNDICTINPKLFATVIGDFMNTLR